MQRRRLAIGSWRGWSTAVDPAAGTVISERLPRHTKVANGLFPKTRSWFALGAPLELLSPLSLLRIVVALDALIWAVLTLVVGRGEVRTFPVLVVEAATALCWLGLLGVRRVGALVAPVVVTALSVASAVLLWSTASRPLDLALGATVVPAMIPMALFYRLRLVAASVVFASGAIALALAGSGGLGSSLAAGAIEGVVIALVVVTVLVLRRSSRRQGAIDPDTGLPNATGLADELGRRGGPAEMVVAAVLLEGVSDARAALGHGVGIELLRRAVEHLGQVVPSDVLLGRIEGDELIVARELAPLSEHPTPATFLRLHDEARELAGSLIDAIDDGTFLVGGIEVSLRAHVGIAFSLDDSASVAELIRRASLSARQASLRRQPSALFEGDTGAMTAEDLELLAALGSAVERGELWLAYQPQVDATGHRTVSVEALMRWERRDHGPVSPGRFIPLAERTGLIDKLTAWALVEALDAQQRWRAEGTTIPVSVNLSAKTLTKPDLAQSILDELEERGLPTSCLSLEVTETAAAADLVLAVDLLRPLHEAGVRISIDDFGTGYTSLSLLPELPLDELKVDQQFVLRSPDSPADAAIVATVVQLAHRLGLTAVAEGVESEAVGTQLEALGYDLLQGFCFSRPLGEAALLEHLRAQALEEEAIEHR